MRSQKKEGFLTRTQAIQDLIRKGLKMSDLREGGLTPPSSDARFHPNPEGLGFPARIL